MTKKHLLILIGVTILAGVLAIIFYWFNKKPAGNATPAAIDNSFIQTTAQSPAVEGNIINSGIAGKAVLLGGGPYEYEASLEIFSAGPPLAEKPFISVRTHSDGTFQVPLKPGNYVLKPMDPDGPIAPVKDSYNFTIGDGQWLQVKIEYK